MCVPNIEATTTQQVRPHIDVKDTQFEPTNGALPKGTRVYVLYRHNPAADPLNPFATPTYAR